MSQAYTEINGIKCYAPELLESDEHFPRESFDQLFRLEDKHFWFQARNRLINRLIKKFARSKKDLLEIGCGTGIVLSNIKSQHPDLKLMGAELHLNGIYHAKQRLSDIEFIQVDARNLPFNNQLDMIGAFDVLEHIEEDELVLKNIHKALKNDGLFFISVPQHMGLWSAQDEVAKHKRRYSRKELVNKLQKSGFKVEFISSFVFCLLPMMYLSRLNKQTVSNSDSELDLSIFSNNVCSFFMHIDELLIRLGLSLPAGGSLFVVAGKR
ncbi:MAG: ric methyltransferase [Gammaproteobacteria bacterium]|jgi:SAM-dependent methyltransferase|nr:ric methyltransferase [Gammaproteobacteria bacterium]